MREEFKDVMGRMRTQSLFYEYRREGMEYFWTLGPDDIERDGRHIPSLKRIYMSYDHIPDYEYQFAMDLFDSWEHWQRLTNTWMVNQYIIEWKKELLIKLKAVEIGNMLKASKKGDTSAAKYLIENKHTPTRGRPSKAELQGHLKNDKKEAAALDDMSSRVTSLLDRKKA